MIRSPHRPLAPSSRGIARDARGRPSGPIQWRRAGFGSQGDPDSFWGGRKHCLPQRAGHVQGTRRDNRESRSPRAAAVTARRGCPVRGVAGRLCCDGATRRPGERREWKRAGGRREPPHCTHRAAGPGRPQCPGLRPPCRLRVESRGASAAERIVRVDKECEAEERGEECASRRLLRPFLGVRRESASR